MMIFTPQEQNYCQSVSNCDGVAWASPNLAYTLCFAIKEAVSKALGIGLVEIDWNEVETDLTQEQPAVCLHGRAKTQAQILGIQQWLVDWWEWQDCVVVNVLALSTDL